MSERKASLSSIGDPNSEINVQRRLNFLRQVTPGGTVFVPKRWVDDDPAFAQAVLELDWLQIERQ